MNGYLRAAHKTKAPGFAGGYLRVPGMTHRPPFQTEVWNMMVRRYRTEGRRQQGKGITRKWGV